MIQKNHYMPRSPSVFSFSSHSSHMSLKELFQKISLKGKKVLIRVDFNVPLDKNATIADDTRIRCSLLTIQYVLDQGAIPILMSHLGRPKGKFFPEFSLAPCAKKLSSLLGKPVVMAPDCIGAKVESLVSKLNPGEVLLLENLRFYEGEEKPEENPSFVEQLAKLGDAYVNDAFGTAHRKHTSTYTLAKHFQGKAAAGFLLEKEIQFLGKAILNPHRPLYALIGGTKISSKIGVIRSLVRKVDLLLMGGAMAFTFLKVKGVPIGNSLFEFDSMGIAKEVLETFEKVGVRLILPIDHVIVPNLESSVPPKIVTNEEGIPSGWMGVDIGPKTVSLYSQELSNAKTIFWNGPMGVFEKKAFAAGTRALAWEISKFNATTIVGGGDSVAAIQQLNLSHQFTHLSTGGGAALEYLEFGTLPGIEALTC